MWLKLLLKIKKGMRKTCEDLVLAYLNNEEEEEDGDDDDGD